MMIYVLDQNGKPLMPTCRKGKVRRLLREGKAIIVKRTPFTIQLTYESGGHTQKVTLGVDTGSKKVGLSATTTEKELFSSEVSIRTDIVELLSSRSQSRRSRRKRLRYREARFLNRTRSKKEGWLPPSISHKIQTHLRVIRDVHTILPISRIVVEVASFNIKKLKDEYIQGERSNFWNVREYVLFRDKHTCQHCKGKSRDNILQVHHLESRKTGGDAPNNLLTLCKTCHSDYHKGKISLNVTRGKKFNHTIFMGVMRNELYKSLQDLYLNVSMTYGYITKDTRIRNGLPKEHRVDALCISENPLAKRADVWYQQKKVRCHNRQIHKHTMLSGGRKKNNQSPYEVKGFRLFDKVLYNNKEYFVFARRITGFFRLKDLNGNSIDNGSTSFKKLELVETRKSMLVLRLVNR